MIRHIVWWTINENGQSLKEILAHLENLAKSLKEIPSLTAVEVSSHILQSSTVQAQFILMSSHNTLQDLEDYRIDPVHQKFARAITEVSSSRNCIDYSVE